MVPTDNVLVKKVNKTCDFSHFQTVNKKHSPPHNPHDRINSALRAIREAAERMGVKDSPQNRSTTNKNTPTVCTYVRKKRLLTNDKRPITPTKPLILTNPLGGVLR